MPSAVTGLISAHQQANAAKDAAAAQEAAAGVAGKTVTASIDPANQQIDAAAKLASTGVTGAAQTSSDQVNAAAQQANLGLNPYQQTGSAASTSLASMVNNPAEFKFSQDDPSYQFRLAEGQKALERSAAARGSGQGGAALKAISRYGQDYASTEYGKAFDRFQTGNQNRFSNLATLSGQGLNASSQAAQNTLGAATTGAGYTLGGAQYAGNAGMNSANTQANNSLEGSRFLANTQLGVGDAQAAGHIGSANAWTQGLGAVGSAGDAIVAGAMGAPGGFSLGGTLKAGAAGLKPKTTPVR